MNWETILTGLWQVVNSVPAIMAMAALLGWLLTKLYAIRPAWEVYEGTIISAIKHAEKAIPDDSPSNRPPAERVALGSPPEGGEGAAPCRTERS